MAATVPSSDASSMTSTRKLPDRSSNLLSVEAITRSDEPDQEGWTFFLDLWTEDGPARLHIEGWLEESGDRLEATLNDILP